MGIVTAEEIGHEMSDEVAEDNIESRESAQSLRSSMPKFFLSFFLERKDRGQHVERTEVEHCSSR